MPHNASNHSDSEVNCLLFPDKPIYCEVLVTCKRVSASLSIAGTIFVLIIIILFKRYRYFSQRLIIHLCVASLMLSVAFILTDINEEATPLCVAQGALVMFFSSCVCIWMMVIMANLYSVTFYSNSLQKFEKPLALFCWLLPVLFMTLPFAGSHIYGPAGVWCWIINDWRWRFGIWYIIRTTSVIMFVIVSIRIIYHVIKMARINSSTVTDFYASHDEVRTLRMYPIVYFLVHIFSIINRIQNAISDKDENGYVFGLLLIQTLCEPFVGGALSLAFVINKKTIESLTRKKILESIQVHWHRSSSDIMEYRVFE